MCRSKGYRKPENVETTVTPTWPLRMESEGENECNIWAGLMELSRKGRECTLRRG